MPEASQPTAGDLVRDAIATGVARLREHGARTRVVGPDTSESVHQARVATRRLRSDLRTFHPFLERAWADSLRDDLRWLGAALGRARDADVLVARLRHRAAALPESERLAAEHVVEHLAAQQHDERRALAEAWIDPRAAALLERLDVAASAPRLLPEAWLPARRALRPVVRRPWRDLRRGVARLGPDPSDHALHEVRILAKRCRYASEAAAPALGDDARRFTRALARLQDTLGEHQDAVVARAWLAKTAADLPAPEAHAAGMLAGVELVAAAEARAAVAPAWKRVRRTRPTILR